MFFYVLTGDNLFKPFWNEESMFFYLERQRKICLRENSPHLPDLEMIYDPEFIGPLPHGLS